MTRARWLALTVCAASLVTAQVAGAGRLGLEAHGGFSRLTMSDVNDSLASLNRQLGADMDRLDRGTAWGLGLRLWTHPRFLLRLGFERLEARSGDSKVELDLDANVFTLGGAYFLPWEHPVRIGIGGGFGPYYADGRFGGSGASLETSGTGFGGRVTVEALWPLRRGLSMIGILGYRWGGVESVQIGESLTPMRAQYEGPFLSLGAAVGDHPPDSNPSDHEQD